MPDSPIKLLFATRTSPFAGGSGSGAYVSNLLQYLSSNGFCIHVLWTDPPDLVPSRGWYAPVKDGHSRFSLEIMGTIKIGRHYWKPDIVWLPFKARASHRIKTVLQYAGLWSKSNNNQTSTGKATEQAAVPPNWGSACTQAETIAVHRAIRRFKPDVVIANYAWMAPAVGSFSRPRPPCAVLTHDVRQRQLHLANGKTVEIVGEQMSPEAELASLQSADALIAIQSAEATFFRRLLPNKCTVTAPMPVRPRPQPVSVEPVALFVGSDHGPNVAGLRWFIEAVWPLVRKEIRSAQLLVVGGVCTKFASPQPDGVQILGRLSHLEPVYARAAVVIAPILQGSGIKIKILEAAGFGRACVTTSVGLEGLEALQPELRVADNPVDFASEVANLLGSPEHAATSARRILELADQHYSVSSCFDPVASMLRNLASQQP